MGLAEESRKSPGLPRQEGIKTLVAPRNRADPVPVRRDPAALYVREKPMSVVVYIVLTLAIFALLGLVQKLVEGL